MTVLSRFHEQCGGEEGRNLDGVVLKRLLVAAKERNQGPQGPLVRSFGHPRFAYGNPQFNGLPCSMGQLAYRPMSPRGH